MNTQKSFDEAQYYKDELHSIGMDPSDEELRAKVLEVLEKKWLKSIEELSLKVEDGRVYLEGKLVNEADRKNILEMLKSLGGIKSVIDMLI